MVSHNHIPTLFFSALSEYNCTQSEGNIVSHNHVPTQGNVIEQKATCKHNQLAHEHMKVVRNTILRVNPPRHCISEIYDT